MPQANRTPTTNRAAPFAAEALASVSEPRADVEIVTLAEAIMDGHAGANRLCDEEETTESRGRKAQIRGQIAALIDHVWDMRAELAAMPATTAPALRAKARVVREFSDCADGANPYENDALTWSLANDLLGIESHFMTEAEMDARPEPLPPCSFREQFPLYRRAPDDLPSWLVQAREDHAALGLIPDIQAHEGADMLTFDGGSRAELDALYERLKAVHDRWEVRCNALRGALIQVAVARFWDSQPEMEGAPRRTRRWSVFPDRTPKC